ncbi:MAG: hypothetical protein ACJ77M_11890, partial [Thermoleophilaceae bacterium]
SPPGPLAWAPPALSNPTTIDVTRSDQSITLDQSRDYVIELPPYPLVGRGGLAINGGHNVVLIGGEIDIPWQGASPGPCCNYGRGLFLLNQTGTVHVEGLYLHGEDLNEGIDLGQPAGAVVQIENVRIEDIHARDPDPVTGVPSSTHPDLIQTWGGPRQLLVDRLSGTTEYQGFFLNPNELYSGPAPELMDFRHVDITGLQNSAYLLWKVGDWPLRTTDVWASPRAGRAAWSTFWPNQGAWGDAQMAAHPGGGFVPQGVAGAGYRTPGYMSAGQASAAVAARHRLVHRAARRVHCRPAVKRRR